MQESLRVSCAIFASIIRVYFAVLKIFRAPIYGARRAVFFAIAQLSCNTL